MLPNCLFLVPFSVSVGWHRQFLAYMPAKSNVVLLLNWSLVKCKVTHPITGSVQRLFRLQKIQKISVIFVYYVAYQEYITSTPYKLSFQTIS